ncbi:MAG: SDR family oxidoreductase [Burkholderiaceae bacterium]
MEKPRRIFITGASSGLGMALARAYAQTEPGVVLGLLARRSDRIETLASELVGASCHCYTVDVLDACALKAAAEQFLRDAGGVDIVIANAGISSGTVTGESGDSEVFARIVQTNLTAMAQTFDVFLPVMRASGAGRLVGIASVAGIRGLPGAGAYSASKAGAIAYLESLRVELKGSPIKVITIAPGYIQTPMTEHNRYPMPFLMPAQRFAEKALRAIDAGRSFVVIPWQMGWVARVLRQLPNAVFDFLFSRAPRKAREPEMGPGNGAE